MVLNYLANIARYLPELILCVTMVGLVMVESTYDNDREDKPLLFTTSVIGLISALALLIGQMGEAPYLVFTNSIVIDPFSTVLKIIMIVGTLACSYLAYRSMDIEKHLKAEFLIISIL